MTLQVQIQSGSGGGLLVVTTVSLDRITPGSAVVVQAQLYEEVKGDTDTPQTGVFVRRKVQSWTDTFTAVADGPSNDLFYPAKDWVLLVKGTGGTPNAWAVTVEVSLDGVKWEQILQRVTANGIDTYARVENKWGYYMRIRCLALTLGPATNIIAQVGGFP